MGVTEQSLSTQTARASSLRARKIREALQGYLFLLPGTFLLLAFNLIPIGYALFISLHKWRIQKGELIWFDNFLKALGEPRDILYVIGGLILLGASWVIWRKIRADTSPRALIWRGLVALMLIIGGFGLIFGFPKMLENGDRLLFQSLVITFMYSLGTVPFSSPLYSSKTSKAKPSGASFTFSPT